MLGCFMFIVYICKLGAHRCSLPLCLFCCRHEILLAGLSGRILHEAVSTVGCSDGGRMAVQHLAREGTKCVRCHIPQLGSWASLQGRSVLLPLSPSSPVPGSSLHHTSVCVSVKISVPRQANPSPFLNLTFNLISGDIA